MFKNNIKSTWRHLWQNKSTSLMNIGGLALAMAVVLLILMWVQNELRYDGHHPDADRIYMLTDYTPEFGTYSELSPIPVAAAIRESVPEVDAVAIACMNHSLVLQVGEEHFKEKSHLYVDSAWMRLFSYDILDGSIETFINNPHSLLITESSARKYFGDEPAMEQFILIDSVAFSIAGIIKDPPAYSSFGQDILIPISNHPHYGIAESQWTFAIGYLFAKLNPQTSSSAVEEKIQNAYTANIPWYKEERIKSRLIPLVDMHLNQMVKSDFIRQGNPQNIRIFSILSALLLITACFNFINLSIARMGVRLKEIGIRKIVGAGKSQLFTQVMTETLIAVLLAFLSALVLVILMLPFFNIFTDRQLVLDPTDGTLWLLIGGIFVFVLMLTGIYPSLLLATLNPLKLMKNIGLASSSRIGFRKTLVVIQLTLAVFMIIGVIVTHRQFAFIQQQVLGYQKEQVFKIVAPPSKKPIRANDKAAIEERITTYKGFKNDLQQSSAIVQASKVHGVSIINDKEPGTTEIVWKGYPPVDEETLVQELYVDEGFLEVANLTLEAGRWFDLENVSDKHNIVLNETAVRTFGLQEPVVGTHFSGGGLFSINDGTVIGVVKDFHHKSLHEKIDPIIIYMDDPFMGMTFWVKAQAGQVNKALQDTKTAWEARFSGEVFEYVFLDEEFDKLYKEDRKALTFSLLLGGLSIVIACLGLLGMIIISTQIRIKEIGIRKVLGASVTGIVSMLSTDFLRLVLIASLLASPIAWLAMNKWLENYVYHINLQWWIFAAAAILAIFIVLLTVSLQAIRAALANPVDSLRDE